MGDFAQVAGQSLGSGIGAPIAQHIKHWRQQQQQPTNVKAHQAYDAHQRANAQAQRSAQPGWWVSAEASGYQGFFSAIPDSQVHYPGLMLSNDGGWVSTYQKRYGHPTASSTHTTSEHHSSTAQLRQAMLSFQQAQRSLSQAGLASRDFLGEDVLDGMMAIAGLGAPKVMHKLALLSNADKSAIAHGMLQGAFSTAESIDHTLQHPFATIMELGRFGYDMTEAGLSDLGFQESSMAQADNAARLQGLRSTWHALSSSNPLTSEQAGARLLAGYWTGAGATVALGGAAAGVSRIGLFGRGVESSHMLSSIERVPSNIINKQFVSEDAIAAGWKPPYPDNLSLRKITTAQELKFYRVHVDPNRVAGRFLVREKEIAPFLNDPDALRLHLGLPDAPIYITEVNVPAGTELYVGRIGAQENFGLMEETGFQYQTVGKLPLANFTNTRPILELNLSLDMRY